jgi:sigma-B regulation protein RsbU (phosphoserine phosphatase)
MKDNRLHSLLEITNAINSNLPVESLFKIFSFILKEQLSFSRFVLFIKEEEWHCPVKVGYKGRIDLDLIHSELYRFKEITLVQSSNSNLLNDFQAVIPVLPHDFHSGQNGTS